MFKDDLIASGNGFDHILADYLSVAHQEVNVARYLEEGHNAAYLSSPKHVHEGERVTDAKTDKASHAKTASNLMQVPHHDVEPRPKNQD